MSNAPIMLNGNEFSARLTFNHTLYGARLALYTPRGEPVLRVPHPARLTLTSFSERTTLYGYDAISVLSLLMQDAFSFRIERGLVTK